MASHSAPSATHQTRRISTQSKRGMVFQPLRQRNPPVQVVGGEPSLRRSKRIQLAAEKRLQSQTELDRKIQRRQGSSPSPPQSQARRSTPGSNEPIKRLAKRHLRDEDPAQDLPPERAQKLGDRVESSRKRIKLSSAVAVEGAIKSSHIGYWAHKKTWPEDFKVDKMNHLLANKGSMATLSRKRSQSSFSASDERPREEKSAPYRHPSYPTFLSDNVDKYKSYLKDHELGLSAASNDLLQELLQSVQTPPNNTVFRDNVFLKHISKLKGKNESRVIQDLSPLLVPSPETLASLGADHLDGIVESVNEGWNACVPITKPRPQPDSAVGYGLSSFTNQQLENLRPALRDATFSSCFKATYYMLFPFLTKEVKTGTMGLGIADNQNAHSMTIAVRAVVELFKLVNREQELHQEIVAFAISHDDESVRLYAYYPIIEGDEVTVWRHTAARFYLDVNTRWISHTFTTNIYDIFSPMHLDRIRSAIDNIQPASYPANIEPLLQRDTSSTTSGLSQQLEVTPSTSVQTDPKSPIKKKSKNKEVTRTLDSDADSVCRRN